MMHSMSPPIYHCDIKPENIMVTSGGSYLIDFGYATINKSEKIHTSRYTPMELFIKQKAKSNSRYEFNFEGRLVDRAFIWYCYIYYCLSYLSSL